MQVLADLSVQPTSDPNVKAYNTRFEMVSVPETGHRGCASELSDFSQILLEIRGITQVYVGAYVLLVTKAPLFQWCEIDGSVTDLLKHFVVSQKQLEDATDSKVKLIDRVQPAQSATPIIKRKAPTAN